MAGKKVEMVRNICSLFLVGMAAGLAFPGENLYGREVPRIVNIVNFIRQTEPRDPAITDQVLFETVAEQVKLLRSHSLRGTFLLQYDALINPAYRELLNGEMERGSEVGAWWEITEPHVKAAGLEWRGRYPWDWHADVGFSTGYTPEERERLVDVYMEEFRSAFGVYPSSVGSWFIDAHTLAYMYDRYGIVASCNCKDQVGTDGYTLWGGYWNQAYYPSRLNAYMPAQDEDAQIPVPVFRMLGSDPVYQYDTGLGHSVQGVITLEPVYPDAGGNSSWVRRFLHSMTSDPCIGFNYVQAGQENSFTWAAMEDGLSMQMDILDSLEREGAVRIETLAESGKWFRSRYRVTPPTSVTVLSDTYGKGLGTMWYDSRYYRANLLWDRDSIRFRDLHLFDQDVKSGYVDRKGTGNQCVYRTCAVMDGFSWSTPEEYAGIRFMGGPGYNSQLHLSDVSVGTLGKDRMRVDITFTGGTAIRVIFSEEGISFRTLSGSRDWRLVMSVPVGKELPLHVEGDFIVTSHENGNAVRCISSIPENDGDRIAVIPVDGKIYLDCSSSGRSGRI